jgi:hypothetical protein
METKVRKPILNFMIFLCLVGLAAVPLLVYDAIRSWIPPPDWVNLLVMVIAAIILVALVGLWRMQRWVVWLYLLLATLAEYLIIFDGFFSWYTLVIQVLMVIGCFAFYRQMEQVTSSKPDQLEKWPV